MHKIKKLEKTKTHHDRDNEDQGEESVTNQHKEPGGSSGRAHRNMKTEFL